MGALLTLDDLQEGEYFIVVDGYDELGPAEEGNYKLITTNTIFPPCEDLDGDGYGDPISFACEYPELDCDDTDPTINPGAVEHCGDDIDNDCDDLVDIDDDSDCPCTDSDGDGSFQESYCGSLDCDDGNNEVHPGHHEVPGNGIDDDCDGRIDEPQCFVGEIF